MPMNSAAPRRCRMRSDESWSRPSPESTMNRTGWIVVSALISLVTIPTEVGLPLEPPCARTLRRDDDGRDAAFPEYLPSRRHLADTEPDQGSVGREAGGDCIAGNFGHVGQVQLGPDDV